MTTHAQPQEVLPDKTLRSGRRWSKSEKTKSGTGESAETPPGAKDLANHCGCPVWSVKDFQLLYGFKRHQWAEAVCELHQCATSLEH